MKAVIGSVGLYLLIGVALLIVGNITGCANKCVSCYTTGESQIIYQMKKEGLIHGIK